MSNMQPNARNHPAVAKGWAIALAILLGIVVLAPLTFSTGIGAIETLTGHNDMTLSEGLEQTRAFVDATVSEVAGDRTVVPAPDNADPLHAAALHNNHSFSDHSRPIQYPGYDDCDSWRNIVLDGWSAIYRVEITLNGEQDAQRLLSDTRRAWERRGRVVETMIVSTRAHGSTLHIPGYSLHVDPFQREAVLTGWTGCLPPT